MIIEKTNDNFVKLLEKLNELKDKAIFQAYHTFGTMFLFDLGEKTEHLSLGRLNLNGENAVIVENYTWAIKEEDKVIVDSKNSVSLMRRNIPNLVDKKIVEIEFDKEKSLFTFVMTENYSLEVTLSEKKKRDIGIALKNTNWIDIGPGESWQELTADHVD